jgi:hypothetical protein
MKTGKFVWRRGNFYEKSDTPAAWMEVRVHFRGTKARLLQRQKDE